MMLGRMYRRKMHAIGKGAQTSAKKQDGLRILIIDGYSPEGRQELTDGGASEAGDLYKNMLTKCAGPISTSYDVLYPSDAPFETPDLSKYHGIAWTGMIIFFSLIKNIYYSYL